MTDLTLYHFTCADHGAPGIDRTGSIRPGSDFGVEFPQSQFAWFTDLDSAPRAALGLSDRVLTCDRMARRYTVRAEHDGRTLIYPWMLIRRVVPAALVDALETTEGAMPMHWYVAAEAVAVR